MGHVSRRQMRGAAGRERGVSLVEFAIIMPVLFMLLIGMITGGMTLSRHNSVKNAVREGTRFGAVNPLTAGTVDSYLQEVIDQTREGATGDLAGTAPNQYICASVVYEIPATPTTAATTGTVRRIEQNGVLGTSSAGSCFFDTRPAEEFRVQVEAKRTSEIEGVLFSLNPTLSSRSVTRYER